MTLNRHILFGLICLLAGALFEPVSAQTGFQIDVPKPKPYENRVLKAEKTTDTRLKTSKRFFQNLTTRYNYYFNANNKLNEVVIRAKNAYKDDYSTLLSFYNYSLDVTAQDKVQLDSVIYKSKTGIVNHDLRSDWMDNLYLLWGASYFYEKKFDSAVLMFQFINYAFADKEKDGYYKYIGSRMDGSDAQTISTKEQKKLVKDLVSPRPSRNDAFIWRIRTLIETGQLASAGSLMATLKNDATFPERLKGSMEELQAYWYYKMGQWDSSATHLVNALDQAATRQERARWEYLAAQMFEKSGKPEAAEKLYEKALTHTIDPIMDIYIRLNLVRLNKSGGENYVDQNIAELVKMAKRDKYEDYRDVIYFMAARMEMDRNNLVSAQQFLLKGAKYSGANPAARNNAYLMIADLYFDQKQYLLAASFYDSIQVRNLEPEAGKKVQSRKAILAKIVLNSEIVSRQDSLQAIAAMPEPERTAYINRLLKKLNKQAGLAEEEITSGRSTSTAAPPDLFNSGNKGDWYFYNISLKTSGAVDFKQNWGNRPNVDNWRRFADVNQQLLAKAPNNTRPTENLNTIDINKKPSFEALLNNLPIGDAKLRVSNDSVKTALFNLGVLLMNDLEDYSTAATDFEKIRTRYQDFIKMDELLFNLYYCYSKLGNVQKAEELKKALKEKYTYSRFATIAETGKDPLAKNQSNPAATKAYEDIYELFIEGKFTEAEEAKKNADSVYRTSYWQPQLLYIEAVYHIRLRDDSVAKNILQTLIGQNALTPIATKAQNLLSVLNRRKQIEDELTHLQLDAPPEDTTTRHAIVQKQGILPPPGTQDQELPLRKRSVDSIALGRNKAVVLDPLKGKTYDTVVKKQFIQNKTSSGYLFDPAAKHYAMIILDKVDVIFINEAKNAFNRYNEENYYNQPLTCNLIDLDTDHKLLLVGDFASAQEATDWAVRAKRNAPNEIVPWLKADKYSFSVTTDWNLTILKDKKDLVLYRKFIDQYLPGKF